MVSISIKIRPDLPNESMLLNYTIESLNIYVNYFKYKIVNSTDNKYIIYLAEMAEYLVDIIDYLVNENNPHYYETLLGAQAEINKMYGEWKIDICYLGKNSDDILLQLYSNVEQIVSNSLSKNKFKLSKKYNIINDDCIYFDHENWDDMFSQLNNSKLNIPNPNILSFVENLSIDKICELKYVELSDIIERNNFNIIKIISMNIEYYDILIKIKNLIRKYDLSFIITDVIIS